VKYFLDTNVCVALIKGTPEKVRRRLEQRGAAGHDFFVSSVVVFELWFGVAKSSRVENNRQRLASFLNAPIEIVPFDDQDAVIAGTHRATLERVGRPIGAYDILIAAQALRHGGVLVTANVSEFSRIRDLRWEDWSKD